MEMKLTEKSTIKLLLAKLRIKKKIGVQYGS